MTSLLKAFFVAFLRVIHLVSRRQEYRADELACIVAGRQNLIDGLQAIHRASTAWPAYWKNEVSSALNDGNLVALADGFARFVSVPEISVQIEKALEKRLKEEKTSPYDTHPALKERIEAAEKLTDGSTPPETQPAITLIENLPATEMKFVRECVEDVPTNLNYVPVDKMATGVAIPSWEKFVTEYAEALKGVTVETVPNQLANLREIGSRIRDPKGMLLSPHQRTVRAGRLFASAVALLMIRNGWELQVQPGMFRMRHGDRELNPFELMGQLMKAQLTREAWRARFNQVGLLQLALLPEDAVAAEPPPRPPQSELFHAEASKPSV